MDVLEQEKDAAVLCVEEDAWKQVCFMLQRTIGRDTSRKWSDTASRFLEALRCCMGKQWCDEHDEFVDFAHVACFPCELTASSSMHWKF